ncbi:hypothetical protein BJ166DRAFT_141030 [Pestalotiopsis sp. NC0098]|nr:hypothetical protein BJ166DRAFT_141030 [Pestalotiopsis sp. NC0098]
MPPLPVATALSLNRACTLLDACTNQGCWGIARIYPFANGLLSFGSEAFVEHFIGAETCILNVLALSVFCSTSALEFLHRSRNSKIKAGQHSIEQAPTSWERRRRVQRYPFAYSYGSDVHWDEPSRPTWLSLRLDRGYIQMASGSRPVLIFRLMVFALE